MNWSHLRGPLRDNEPEGLPPEGTDAELAQLKARLEASESDNQRLKMLVQRPQQGINVPQPSPPSPSPAPAPSPSKEDITKEFWRNPLDVTAAIARQVAQETTGALAAATFDNNVAVARGQARATDPEFFDKFVSDIEEKVSVLPPQMRLNPSIWKNAMNLVKGEKIDDVVKWRSGKENVAPALHLGPSTPSTKPVQGKKEAPLTPEQLTFCKKFGLTEEEYRRGIRRNENQEESWAEVLTFDSRDKRRRQRNAAGNNKSAA